MRRIIARGRMMPQSLSTDPRIGQLSLKAALLYDRLWINSDDQGRISGNAHEIKYAACPNIDHIAKTDIPELLKELDEQELIKVYTTSKAKAVQMLDWWEVQKLQWASPSEYPPPEGWTDSLRYHRTPQEIITKNWPPASRLASELLPSRLPSLLPSKLDKERQKSGKKSKSRQDPPPSPEKEEEGGRRRGRGRVPSALGSNATPSPATSKEILDRLRHCYEKGWGKIPGARISAQLRDLSNELSAARCPVGHIDEAFREAAVQNKLSVRYVRAILLAWLGVDKEEVRGGRSPPNQ